MVFWILLFIGLTFLYDILRGTYKNSIRQVELSEKIIEQNNELIKLLSKKDS
jgi:hypothetical protein